MFLMRMWQRILGVFFCCATLSGMLAAQPPCATHPSHISMASGSFSTEPGVVFNLKHFVATLVPMGPQAPVCYQKMTVVSHAEIFVDNASLTRVFTQKLGGAESKIKDFEVKNGLGKVTLSGTVSKIIPIHFTIEGPVTTDGAMLLLDARSIKADGIPVKALLALVGEHLSSVFALKGVGGVAVNENTLSFSPEAIAHLKGYITGVETSDAGVTLHYGKRPGRGISHAAQHAGS